MPIDIPIIYTGPMVRAIQARAKRMTRRIMDRQPVPDAAWAGGWRIDSKKISVSMEAFNERGGRSLVGDPTPCRYGQPGDRHWVRETCRAHELTDKEAEEDTFGVMERLGLEIPPYGLGGVIYHADNAFREIENTREASEAWAVMHHYRGKRGATVPPIHMPRWASRITLEVQRVRVERLQDISEADAIAEGCLDPRSVLVLKARRNSMSSPDVIGVDSKVYANPIAAFRALWERINGTGSWDDNPWVWVIEFKEFGAV